MIDLSIILVNYKTPELITVCAASIYRFVKDISFEIIVVNNASKADDEAVVKQQFPKIRWIETGCNAGFGRANNVGMKNAKGKYLLLLNSDTVIIDDSIQRGLNRYKSAYNVAVAGASQLTPDLRSKPIIHSFSAILRYAWLLFPHKKADELINCLIPEKKYVDSEEVDFVPGAFMLLSKEIFEATGGFDEEFFMYAEDVEWSCRLKKLGKTVVFSDCKFIHDEWGSSPERKKQQLAEITYFNRFDRQAQLSNLVWIRKHFGAFYFVALMKHYWFWIPLFFMMKLVTNLAAFRNPFRGYSAQRKFAKTITIFTRYFFRILFQKTTFYKINGR